MNIGIDASCWANKRGYGRYTRELIRAILEINHEHEYTLFLDADTERRCHDLPKEAGRVVVATNAAAADAASASGHRSLRDLWAMSRAVTTSGRDLDLFYFPTVYTFFPVPRRLRPLVTIHDTIAERHPELIFPHRRNRMLWTLKVGWAVRQAHLILTVSQTAKSEVMHQFRLGEARMRVVPDAVSPEFAPVGHSPDMERILAAHGIAPEERFLLYVGGISPHKSIDTLVDAYCALAREEAYRDLRLVVVGDYQGDVFHSSYDALRGRISAAFDGDHAANRVVFTGFVPDAELRYWYSAARALVLPSVDEGFGLPALEAMACGTPVVASRAGALPEVIGDAGLLFTPRAANELSSALRGLLGDDTLQRSLAARGPERASRFSWHESARSAISVFEELGPRR